jgi:hypothetical protein
MDADYCRDFGKTCKEEDGCGNKGCFANVCFKMEEPWISVVDELPEYGRWLFVSDGVGTHFAAYVEHLGFLGTDGEAFDSCVKFWMNLPSPPTGL